MKHLIFTFIIISISNILAYCQVKVDNINFYQKEGLIIVTYNLKGNDFYSTKLFYRTNNDNKWTKISENIVVSPGNNKTFNWDLDKWLNKNNKVGLITNNIQFKVTAEVAPKKGKFIDKRDRSLYKWVRIGKQIWMAENLKATKYYNGDIIPKIDNKEKWNRLNNLYDKARFWYEKNNDAGMLYTWAAAMNGAKSSNSNPSEVQGVCPDGWHLPSKAEWKELHKYISSENRKSKSLISIKDSTFSDYLGGYNWESLKLHIFNNIGNTNIFWSSTWSEGANVYYEDMILSINGNNNYGLSVRCIRNE